MAREEGGGRLLHEDRPGSAMPRSVSSTVHASRLPSRSIWAPPRDTPTSTRRTAMLERALMLAPSPSFARSAALWTAAAARAARCGASSTGSRPNAATIPVGLISSMRPPNVWIFSTSTSSARLGLNPGSRSGGSTTPLRRNASRRLSHRAMARPSGRSARPTRRAPSGAHRGRLRGPAGRGSG